MKIIMLTKMVKIVAAVLFAAGVTLSASAATLTHRWSFNGSTDAQNLTDSVGGAVAWKEKWPSTGSSTHEQGGNVTFSNGKAVIGGGGATGYLNLGTGLLGNSDGTIEIWLKKKFNGNVWSYLFTFGQHDTTGDPGLFTVANARYNDVTRTPVNFRVNSANTGIYGDDAGLPIPVGMSCHVSLTFKSNGSGGTFVRCMFRDCETGFILKEQSCTVNNWTLAGATQWALTLGHNPWVNSGYDVNSEFDEVRCWDGVLNDDQLTAGVIAGPDTVIGGGVENFIVNANTTFDVPTAGGGYGFWTDKTVALGAGSKIRFDTTGYFGKGLRFRAGGFVLPSGSALDFVELSDSENFVATMENANTILVQLKSTIPYESTWSGAAPSAAADLVNPANWTSVNVQGTAISATPTNTTTVILPASVLSTFSVPDGVTVNWGRVVLGGHTKTKYGFKDGSPVNSTLEWRDLALSSYTTVSDIPNGKQQGATYFASTATPSELGTAQIRLDGWFYVTAAQAGKWTLPNKFDDVSAFAIDGQWLYLLNTYRVDSNGGAFVSEGWHRYTIAVGDTGGGWGSNFSVGGANYPFGVAINGAANVAFTEANFTFGTDVDTLQLTRDCDWRALGEINVSSGLTIDLNGHNLAVHDIDRSTLGAVITNSSSSASALYVVPAVPTSKAQASGMSSVPIVQYGQKSAIWSGSANDGNPSTPGNWSITSGAGMPIPDGIPDNATAVTIAGANVNMQVPVGVTLQCASLTINNCTLTADCDWRGLTVTPAITGTADLNGHNLRLNHLSASGGAALANSGTGISAVKFTADNSTDIFEASHYIDGVANLVTADKARVVIEKGDSSAWNLSTFNVNGMSGGYLEGVVSAGSLTSSGGAVTIGANGYGELTVDGGDVTFEKGLNLPGNRSTTGIMNIKSGNLTSTGYVDFGGTGGKESRIVQSGGTVTLSGSSWFGRFSGGPAIYELSAGTFSQTGGSLHLGQIGGGVCHFNQSGGRMTVGNVEFILAYNGSSGTFTQTGGELVSEHEIWVGRDGTAAFNVGGTVTLATGKGLSLGHRVAGSTGSFTLNDGGVLTTSYLRKGAGTAKATFAGGKIVAKDANNAATFISGIGDVTYAAGGLTVDTAGYDVSMANNTVSNAFPGSALVKQGAGTLTVDALPPVDRVAVSNGTLSVLADVDNRSSSDILAHRWSFTGGSLVDSVDGVTATVMPEENAAVALTGDAVALSGDGHDKGYLDLGTELTTGNNATIEIWAKRTAVKFWARMFDYGPAAGNTLFFAWNRGNEARPNLKVSSDERLFTTNTDNLENDKMYHFVFVLSEREDGKTDVKMTFRQADNPSWVKTYEYTTSSEWALSNVSSGHFYIGRSFYSGDSDANAVYDEVRIWNAALSDDAIATSYEKGANATLEDIAAITAKQLESNARVLELAGGTLALNGHILRQPVVKGGSGMVGGGLLDITDSLVVNLTDCIAGNYITANGTIDFSGAKLVFEDPEVLETHKGSIWFMRPTSGGSVALTGNLEPASPLPTGWKISISASGARLMKAGLSIHLR